MKTHSGANKRFRLTGTGKVMRRRANRKHLFETVEWIGWDKLMFATDYPHWDFDDPSRVLPAGVSKENQDAFFLGNARKVFGIAA